MKLSVSLVPDDVAFLDRYAAEKHIPSRSAAIQEAIRVLRLAELGDAYAEAWSEWEATGDAKAWDGATGDGLGEPS